MRTHAVKWALVFTMVALCFVGYAAVQGVLHVMDGWTKDLPSIEDTDFTNTSRESLMYAGDESTLLAEFQLEKRYPVTYDEVSPFVLEGTVDTEDVRFYEHTGVDVPGIARAALNNLRGGNLEGASTITQQLVRNTVLSEEATDISFKRKIREAQLAMDLEKRFDKDDILVKYLNIINYGDGCYGIEAAAQNYFQVAAIDLTLAQAATLVGIPQSPTFLNPRSIPRHASTAATWCSTACWRPATSRRRSTTARRPRNWG
ncbi:transglycosylase domain-containing protein [Eggerthella sinensis]|uniref:transglycosylase domain-containing protein n=1 Tax=Eggerthella sinensis TaxID=242230 RepID=UPI0022E21ADA|nr:biosynthetic peptidoglycan transglycosylase [Eggerthella sinensis]